jgi:hypothetical protein
VEFDKNRTLFTSKLAINLRKELVYCYTWNTAFHCAETCSDHEYFESLDRWWWRRMEKIEWTSCVKNEVLHKVKEVRNTLQTIHKERLAGLVTSYIGTDI